MKVLMHSVESSNIRAVGYSGGYLLVQFHTGAIYQYSGVSVARFVQLKNATSVGKYFRQHIRDNKAIDFERVA